MRGEAAALFKRLDGVGGGGVDAPPLTCRGLRPRGRLRPHGAPPNPPRVLKAGPVSELIGGGARRGRGRPIGDGAALDESAKSDPVNPALIFI